MAIAVGLVAILAVMVIPMPPFLLDLMLSIGIGFAMVLLLTAVYANRALDFSVFPSILVIINFIVITKGAGRVAEVAARFTLDAMPGKQMAIDADLNAGVINEEQARLRRSEIAREADFYGAMDGASKFVRGDAIAGILIVVVNIVGGILIGTLQRGMDIAQAAETFTLLTIGDGLVTQIPALIVSTAAGIIVTRTATSTNYSQEFARQLVMQPKALMAAGAVMGFMAIIPGLPHLPFLILGAVLFYSGRNLKNRADAEAEAKRTQEIKDKAKPQAEKLENLLSVDLLELEVGYGLISIVDADQNGDLLERITNIRKQFALDLGIIVPPLRIRDNLELKPGDYQVLLKGVQVGEGSLMVGHVLAMDPGNVAQPVAGVPTREPAFGLDAIWISPRQKEEATYAGYTVVDLSTVIATHLTELIRQNAPELLGRQELQSLLDTLKQTAPKVVEDVIPNLLQIGTVLKVLKNLLKESVPIRDMRTILETLAEMAPFQKDPQLLTEHVRTALARTITRKLVGPDGKLQLLTLDRGIEEAIAGGIIQTDQGQQLSLDPEFVRQFVQRLNEQAVQLASHSSQAVVLCSPLIRHHLKSLVERFVPSLVVLSHNEITPNVQIQAFSTVRMSHAS